MDQNQDKQSCIHILCVNHGTYNHTTQQFGGLNLHKIYDIQEMNQTNTQTTRALAAVDWNSSDIWCVDLAHIWIQCNFNELYGAKI